MFLAQVDQLRAIALKQCWHRGNDDELRIRAARRFTNYTRCMHTYTVKRQVRKVMAHDAPTYSLALKARNSATASKLTRRSCFACYRRQIRPTDGQVHKVGIKWLDTVHVCIHGQSSKSSANSNSTRCVHIPARSAQIRHAQACPGGGPLLPGARRWFKQIALTRLANAFS